MATLFQFPYRTVAEISLRGLVKNLSSLRGYSRKEVIPVVKADAYGHGMIPVSKALVNRGSAQMLAVATLEEAIDLRRAIPTVSILVLSGFFPHQLDAYLKYRLIPVIHNLNHLKSLQGKKTLPELHLKVDTGMHRLGIAEDELSEAIQVLGKLGVKLAGLATHFADSDVLSSHFVDEQITRFEAIHRELMTRRLLNTDARIHVANTAAVLRGKWNLSVAVRPGLGLYGVSPNPRLAHSTNLQPVLTWKTRILCLKDVPRGQTIGYSRTYKTRRREHLAILPIGYADGFPRLLSSKGRVLIHGKRAPIRGRVSMDLTAVDCSQIPGVKEGTPVTLIGRDSKDSISATEMGHWADTIPYEIFCGISPRVPRLYLD